MSPWAHLTSAGIGRNRNPDRNPNRNPDRQPQQERITITSTITSRSGIEQSHNPRRDDLCCAPATLALLENIARYLFDNIGNILSAKRIADYLKAQRLRVGVDTVQNYLGYFTEALIAHKVLRYDIKGKRHLELHEKYYLNEIGIRHALLGYREADIGGILENIVFLELRRRGYNVSIGKLGEREVDFIATRQSERIYIQVAYLLASDETIEREFGVLRSIPDNYPKYDLSLDTVLGEDFDGIRVPRIVIKRNSRRAIL